VIATELIPFLLRHLHTAGRYSARIQRSIIARPAKSGDTAFQQALSDADLSVQAYLEVALLSRFPEIAFFSEEYAESLNAKYFSSHAQTEVLLDPIDGTRAYLDGADSYQIILSVREHGKLSAALCFLPRRDLCYLAMRGKGATICSGNEMNAMGDMGAMNAMGEMGEMEEGQGRLPRKPVPLNPNSRRIVIFNAPDVKRLLNRKFEVIDIYEEYTARRVHHGFTEILSGQAGACVHPRPQIIDAGAIAFIAEQAGGVLTGFQGEPILFDHPPSERGPGLVVSAARALHDEILAELAAGKGSG
jgi:myo-inositol-1(or 4)-monophosphatase